MISKIISFISLCSPLFPIVTGIRKKNTLLWLYAITGLVFDLAMTILTKNGITMAWVGNIFCIVEFLFICFYYKPRIFKNASVFYITTGLLVGFFIASTIYNSVFVYNNYGETVFDLTCILFALIGLTTLLKEQKNIFIEQSSFFWLNVALLIYNSGNFLIFLFQAYLMSSQKAVIYALWVIHNILNIIFSVLLGISLSRKKP